MGGLLAVLTMAVADAKVVAEVATSKVGAEDKAVLVDFVGVVWNEPYTRRKGVLSDHVPLDKLRLDQAGTAFFSLLILGRSGGSALEF